MTSKRKAAEAELEEDVSEEETPKKTAKRRTKTMEVTKEEAARFLEKEAPNLVEAKEERKNNDRMETRATQQQREAINDLAGSKKKELAEYTPDEEKRLRNGFFMVFRLFDKDGDGMITAEELAEAMRSTGKKVDYDKIDRITKKIGTNGLITTKRFVDYLMKINYKKVAKKKAKAAVKESKPPKSPKKTKAEQAKKEKEKEKEAKKKDQKAKEKEKEKEKAKAKELKDKEKEKAKGKEKEEKEKKEAEKKKKLFKTGSIVDYYGPNVGDDEIKEEVKLDEHKNPIGNEHDLAQDAVFEKIKVLIGTFYSGEPTFGKEEFEQTAGASLKKKGFTLLFASSESKFIELLDEVDVAWIISDHQMIESVRGTQTSFVEAVRDFHESGGGLYIWANNTPFYAHANIVLENLLGMKLIGKSPAGQDLHKTGNIKKGHFIKHEIFTGLQKLYEGKDICYPERVDSRATVIATSNDDHPVIIIADQGPGKLSNKSGRIVVDTGFTKLWQNWPAQAGTPRYVTNATCWLVGIDHKIKHGLPLSRVEPEVSDSDE